MTLGRSRKAGSQLIPLLYELLSNSVCGHHPVEIAEPFEKLRENNPSQTLQINNQDVSQCLPLSYATTIKKFACFPQFPSFYLL